MPQPHKGARIQQTVRIPADVHRRLAQEAANKRWSVNEVITHLLRQGLNANGPTIGERQNILIRDDDGNIIGRA